MINQKYKLFFHQVRNLYVKNDLLIAVTVVLILVIAFIFIGYSNNGVIPAYPKPHYHYVAEPNDILSFMSNWDGPDYLHIASHGYNNNLFYANFFPLYPLAIYIVHFVVPSFLISGLIVAWLCLVGALYFYLQIMKEIFKTKLASDKINSLLPFILFPSGVFLLATYSESLTAFLALGSIYFSLKKRYVVVALMLLLCSASHITALFVVILIAMIMIEHKEKFVKIVFTVGTGCLGFCSYLVYSWQNFGDPFAFLKSQKLQHGWLKHSYIDLLTRADPLNVLMIILLLISIGYWWPKRKSFSVYCALFLAIPLVGRQYGGFNRYVLMAFPLQFMLYGYFKNKKLAYPYLIILMTMGWTYFALQYAAGYIGN